MQAQIKKTLLPSSVMVKISLTDFVQIALLLVTLYMTLHCKHSTEVNILGDYGVQFFFVLAKGKTTQCTMLNIQSKHSSGRRSSNLYLKFKHPIKKTQQKNDPPPTKIHC